MSNLIRKILSFLLIACIILTAAAPLHAQYGTGRDVLGPARILQGDNDPQAGRPVDRRQLAQNDIQESARRLDEMLVSILEMVNRNEKPTLQQLQDCKAAYDAARKYAPHYDDSMKCETFLLKAWTDYFTDDIQQAFLAAKSAAETDRTNHDANATQAAMSILLDRPPLKIEPRRTRPAPGGGADPYARTQGARANQLNVRASSGNILQLDVDAIDASLLQKPVAPMKLTCINGTTLDYNPAQSNLCILFWNLGIKDTPASLTEPNTPGQLPRQPLSRPASPNVYDRTSPRMDDRTYRPQPDARRGAAYEDPGRRDPSYDMYNRPPTDQYGYTPDLPRPTAAGDPLLQATAAYGRLFTSYIINPQVAFVAVNTDPITNAPAVLQKLMDNPWPWANVMAAVPVSGAAQFANIATERPTLAIVDSTGKIKYAGPAEGFLAPMVLQHLAGQPISLADLAGAGLAAGQTPPPAVLGSLRNLLGAQTPPRAQVPQSPPVVAAPRQPAQQTAAAQDDDEEELTPENYAARRKLEAASQLFIPAGRKTLLTSKRGIEICREIIREYPNTKYAREARLLLRQVPENERARYNVTNEEMGL